MLFDRPARQSQRAACRASRPVRIAASRSCCAAKAQSLLCLCSIFRMMRVLRVAKLVRYVVDLVALPCLDWLLIPLGDQTVGSVSTVLSQSRVVFAVRAATCVRCNGWSWSWRGRSRRSPTYRCCSSSSCPRECTQLLLGCLASLDLMSALLMLESAHHNNSFRCLAWQLMHAS